MEGDDAPVGCVESVDDVNKESDTDPVVVVEVFCELSSEKAEDAGVVDEGLVVPFGSLLLNEKEEATLDMSVRPGLRAEEPKLKPLAPVTAGCCCCCGGGAGCCWPPTFPPKPMANSINVGCFGTGGGGVAIGPNGFFVPV